MSRTDFDPTLYLVAGADVCAGRSLVEVVKAAVEGGVTAVQLRDHHATDRDLYETALRLREALADTGASLLVDDRLDIAMAAGVDGVHLGQSDLPAEAAREIAGSELIIGVSVTNLVEAAAAAASRPGTIDYLGVGPIFPTLTKPDAAPAIGVEGLHAVCALTTLPCVAIGGIRADRAPELISAGAAGIAVVTAICSATDPRAAASALRDAASR